MKRTSMALCVACLVCACAVPSSGDASNSNEVKNRSVALGALEGLEVGDAFVYRLRFPKRGYKGAPPHPGSFPDAKPPEVEGHFEKRWVRVVVVNRGTGRRGPGFRLRVDKLNKNKDVLEEGLWYFHVSRTGTEFGDAAVVKDDVPYVFEAYPPFTAVRIGRRPGPQLRAGSRAVYEFNVGVMEDRTGARVEVRCYIRAPHLEDEEAQEEQSEEMRYLDTRKNRIVTDKSKVSGDSSVPVVPRWTETQKWEFGSPFWHHMERYTEEGWLRFECDLFGRRHVQFTGDGQQTGDE